MPHPYPFIPAEFVHGIESFSPRCTGWELSLALLRFELGQGWEAAMLGGTYDCASSETGSPIGLQLFSGLALPERTTLMLKIICGIDAFLCTLFLYHVASGEWKENSCWAPERQDDRIGASTNLLV